MKDDSFNLDALGTFSNSPLRLSDCDLGGAALPTVSTGTGMPLSDVQVTGLYTSYSSQDPLSSQYMVSPANSKPIALLWSSWTEPLSSRESKRFIQMREDAIWGQSLAILCAAHLFSAVSWERLWQGCSINTTYKVIVVRKSMWDFNI